jgi:hypothetical protein
MHRISAAWAIASVAVFGLSLRRPPGPEIGPFFRWPSTPIDQTHGGYADQWRLLWRAAPFIGNQSYTVRCADASGEMTLYMMSLGVLPRAHAAPYLYFGTVMRGEGDQAALVLAYRFEPPEASGLRIVARFPEGTLYRRESR